MGCPVCKSGATGTIIDGWHVMECGSRVFFSCGGGPSVNESALCNDIARLRADLNAANERVKELEGALRLSTEWTDSMIGYCARYLESHPANTERYNPERFVNVMLESLDGPAQRRVYDATRAALAGGGKEEPRA